MISSWFLPSWHPRDHLPTMEECRVSSTQEGTVGLPPLLFFLGGIRLWQSLPISSWDSRQHLGTWASHRFPYSCHEADVNNDKDTARHMWWLNIPRQGDCRCHRVGLSTCSRNAEPWRMNGQEAFTGAASVLSPEPKTSGGLCLLWGHRAWCGCVAAVRLGE